MFEKLKKLSKKRKQNSEAQTRSIFYQGLEGIAPTSNVCERLFSKAGLIWTDLRKSMKPATLEILLFL